MRLQDGGAVKQSGPYMLAYHDAMVGRAVDRAGDEAEPEPSRGVSSWLIALAAASVLGVLAMVYFAFVVPR